MVEFEVQSLTHIRLRVGRLHLRTWLTAVMLLPHGYRNPDVIFSVVDVLGDGEQGPHLATFYSEEAATQCIRSLQTEGRGELAIDLDFAPPSVGLGV